MKRVLLLIPNLDFGGAQTSFARVSQLLSPHCELLLVVFNRDNIAPLQFGARLEDMNVPGAGNVLTKIRNFLQRVVRLKKLKREFKPDISISFLEGADYVNLLSSVGEKIYFYVHGSKVYDRNISGLLGWIRKKIFIPVLYARADGILVVNDQLRKELVQSFGLTRTSYYIIPNFCDSEELESKSKETLPQYFATLLAQYPAIVIVGRLAHEKGIDRFISILASALKVNRSLKLVLVGEGPFRQAIMDRCRQEGIDYTDDNNVPADQASVFFAGFQKNPYSYMKAATFLALPSTNEGMPLTVMEALCLGVPVIASDCPYGPRELLSEDVVHSGAWPEYAKNGVLAPVPETQVDTTEVWTAGILKLIADEELRRQYSEGGITKSKSFTKHQVLSDWLNLIR